MIYDVVIIGAGPAGLMAGITASKMQKTVLILDHMPDCAKKLLICGKGRCNITNNCDIDEFIKSIPGNGKFLYSSLKTFDNEKLIDFFHENDLQTKVERGGRVFPVSDKSIDVKNTLLEVFKKNKGNLKLSAKVDKIVLDSNLATAVMLKDGTKIKANSIIVCTGGASYPKTGSDGSGFKLAKDCGHTIVDLKPALVPLESNSEYLSQLQGLSLRNVAVSIIVDGKRQQKEFGEMLFTHFGLSGPVILTLSNFVAQHFEKSNNIEISIDLKPALTNVQIDNRVKRDFEKFSKKQIKNSLSELLPSSLIPIIIKEAQINEEKFTNQITKQERMNFCSILKDLRFKITATRPISEAIVTAGGVSLKQVNPKTMQSKIIDNIYFAGEVLDIYGFTGGFNLQAAFSTGFLAGVNAAKKREE